VEQSLDQVVALFWYGSARLAGLCLAMPSVTRDPETYTIIGAAMRVHRELGCGFLEAVHREALRLALEADGVPRRSEVAFRIRFAGQPLRTLYRADLVCFDSVLVELKALRALTGLETAQVLNYLKASGLNRALLLNFGTPRPEYRRLVSGPQIPQIEEG
jgi:GxxExxY protein